MSASRTVEDFERSALPNQTALLIAARQILGSCNEAEDVVQETFLQAWKSFHRFELGTNCRAWLYKIMFYVMKRYKRTWLTFRLSTVSPSILATVAYDPPVPENLTDDDVLAAFDRIPAQFRETLILADVQEFSYKEVAQRLNVPVGTVMSRLNRGRKRLRHELAEYAEAAGIQSQPAGASVSNQSSSCGREWRTKDDLQLRKKTDAPPTNKEQLCNPIRVHVFDEVPTTASVFCSQ
jgi:RNA polymerase sigma-70 factor, ECF subfamily